MSTRHSTYRNNGGSHRNDYTSEEEVHEQQQMSGHTEFLDLTNGEGGERNEAHVDAGGFRVDEEDDDDGMMNLMGAVADASPTHSSPGGYHHDDDDEEDEDDEMLPTIRGPHSTTGSGVVDPSTPGKVVPPGQEHTGRWTKEEHEAFLSALDMYGKEWKKVAAKVKTRTVVQTRTHAQKYFQKLQKTVRVSGNVDITQVDMGVSSEVKHARISSSVQKKQKTTTPASQPHHPVVRTSPASITSPLAAPKFNRRSSSTTINAAQVISNLSGASQLPMSGPFMVAGSSAAISSSTPPPPPRHGFGTTTTAGAPLTSESLSSAFPSWVRSSIGGAIMKIAAPDPTSSLRRGFPEPSPAATGKRKLAEIAAARMLAGVGAATSASHSHHDEDDGPPTPPPSTTTTEGGGGFNLKEAPLPPIMTSNNRNNSSLYAANWSSSVRNMNNSNHKGMSLQIVNPENLGVTYERKRSSNGEADSPVTPWEGELKALLDEEDTKKMDSMMAATAATAAVAAEQPTSETSPMMMMQIPLMVTGSGGAAQQHPVLGSGTAYGRTALHKAVCDMDVNAIQNLLKDVANQSEGVLQRKDEAGYRPIHTACALLLGNTTTSSMNDDPASLSGEIVQRLLEAGADASRVDGKGNTPLHWAARAGDKGVVSQLLFKNAALDTKNQSGETPLHWAMRAGYRGMPVVVILLESGARPNISDSNFKRPLDVAGEGFMDDENSLCSIRHRVSKNTGKHMIKEFKKALQDFALERKETRANLLIRSPQSRSLVLHHPECLEHHPKSSADWEAPDRVTSIMRRILPSSDSTGSTETSGIFPHEVTCSQEFDRARLDVLSRVHSTEYLSFVNNLSKDLEQQVKQVEKSSVDESEHGFESRPPVVPFTPLVQRTMIKVHESSVKLSDNSDTSFSAGSLKAARRATGAVQHAVDCVLVGRNRNAFCVVRPPGHHAGINGLLEGGESCGFCIFNNVAAGALYAISDDRLLCERCAIVDIDVHHGNGTEEIVRNCHDPSKLFFFSIHLYDNDKRKGGRGQFQYKFYPGTGAEDDLALNIINVPIVPLWKDTPPAPALVKSHNTRTKARAAAAASQDSQDDSSETGGAARLSDGASETGSTTNNSTATQRGQTVSQSGRLAYRQSIQTRLLPALRAFNPDLILISAGFDAAKGDVGNARHERGGEKMGLDLEPEDYAWATRKILEVADICCNGRVVSVLEGGYGRTPAMARVVPGEEKNLNLDRSLFAECAVRHLHAMVDPYNIEQRFS